MKATHSLTVTIDIRDKEGRKIGEKEVATYHGLLARAHEEGLRSVLTEIVQIPAASNGDVAIVRAVVVTQKGTFTGLGDANPGNVNRRIAGHLLRMAETRAKARALRDAVNIGIVSLEELGDLTEEDAEPSRNGTPPPPARPSTPAAEPPLAPVTGPVTAPLPPRTDRLMTEPQRRLLFRLAVQRGAKPEDAARWLEAQLGVTASLKLLTSSEASRLIDEIQGGKNGFAPRGGDEG